MLFIPIHARPTLTIIQVNGYNAMAYASNDHVSFYYYSSLRWLRYPEPREPRQILCDGMGHHHLRILFVQAICLGMISTISIMSIITHSSPLFSSSAGEDDRELQVISESIQTGTAKQHERISNEMYDSFLRWNRSLCSAESDRRGPHQKVIAVSVYGSSSKYTDNTMFSWIASILEFLLPLSAEVQTLLPSWLIRIYVDFTDSTEAQRAIIANLSNVDVCNISNIPLFAPSSLSYLPGKIWRFLPVFDPLVDYVLSRDLDSPIIRRESETIEMWLSDRYKRKFFYTARDNIYHGVPILGGLWGAAPVRARRVLHDIFQPILIPVIAQRYNGTGDQTFLTEYVWQRVKRRTLSFDSYFCQTFGGLPFPSQRPPGNCFLGCLRPCCLGTIDKNKTDHYVKPCPVDCRPKSHQDWTYC